MGRRISLCDRLAVTRALPHTIVIDNGPECRSRALDEWAHPITSCCSSSTPLYPEIEPFDTGMLALDGLHRMYYEQSGNPKGVPVVFLHGGPGAGANATQIPRIEIMGSDSLPKFLFKLWFGAP